MKKKFLSLALALVMCLSLTIPALAAEFTEGPFVITGDVAKTGQAKCVYDVDWPVYTSNGPVKVDVKVYTPSYNPRNIPLSVNGSDGEVTLMSSVSAAGEDTGPACSAIAISLVSYDASAKEYKVVKEHPICFEGQLEVYEEDDTPRIVSIKDYYTDPSVQSWSIPTLASNATVTLTEPGAYYLDLSCDGPSGGLIVEVKGSAASTTTTTAAAPKFTDVAATSPFAEAIGWAVEKGITKGITDTTFGPSNTCTVSHILTFLWRAAGQPGDSVTDWAKQQGIDAADMSAPCTRAMAVSYMWKAAGSPAPSKSASFSDVSSSADYAKAVSWAVEKGITSGTGDGTTFSPDNTCTRGQIVTFLYRASK